MGMDKERRAGREAKAYKLSKNRKYELIYFCRQYKDWMELKEQLETVGSKIIKPNSKDVRNSTEDKLVKIADLSRNMAMIERTAKSTNEDLSYYIFIAATDGLGYKAMLTKYQIPCSEDIFDFYMSKFYWMLSNRKGL